MRFLASEVREENLPVGGYIARLNAALGRPLIFDLEETNLVAGAFQFDHDKMTVSLATFDDDIKNGLRRLPAQH